MAPSVFTPGRPTPTPTAIAVDARKRCRPAFSSPSSSSRRTLFGNSTAQDRDTQPPDSNSPRPSTRATDRAGHNDYDDSIGFDTHADGASEQSDKVTVRAKIGRSRTAGRTNPIAPFTPNQQESSPPQMPHGPPPDPLTLAWRNDANPAIVAFRSAETYVQRSPAHRQAGGSPPRRLYLCSLQRIRLGGLTPPNPLALAWRNDANPGIVAFRSAETYVQRSPAHRQAGGSPPRRLYLCSLQRIRLGGLSTTWGHHAARRTAYCPRCCHCTRPLIGCPETHE